MSPALALLASLVWGTADFMGGALSRRMKAGTVFLAGQLGSLPVLLGWVLLTLPHPVGAYLWWGFVGGLAGTVALLAFYRALAIGTMSVVAPIAATGVAVPVLVGVLRGERPSVLQVVGIVIAAGGVVLASGLELRGVSAGRTAFGLSLVSALGFGLIFTVLAEGSRTDSVMSLLGLRVGALLTIGIGAAVTGGRLVSAPAGRDWPVLALVGLLDLGAIAAYTQATRGSLVSVVAVLSSLYPVVTVLLARKVYDERLRGAQLAGVVGALVGVVLLASA